ncbi:MAG: histidinol-phosphate aminotransferase family protein [Clostridia bacterium]|nr:histidinol-phosphate aminotransferase family protein [Clostridia bacterium]
MRHGGNVWQGEGPSQWLDFSANLRPEGPPDWVLEAMAYGLKNVRYYPDRAMAKARAGLAAYAGTASRCILPTAGGAAAIDLVLQRSKGSVYIAPPTFGEYEQRAMVHGRQCRPWQGSCGKGDTVFLANPNNPTGLAMARSQVLEIYEKVAAQGGEVIVDEAFIDYCPEHSVRRDVKPGLAVVGSLTKILSIPGIRLGYVCAHPEAIEELARRALPWSISALAAEIAGRLGDHLPEISQDAAVNRRRRERFREKLQGLGIRVTPSQGSFLLVELPIDAEGIAAELKKRGILVRTCASFGLPRGYLRLAVKTDEENERLIRELGEILYAR